jgi:hypothetical protein
MKKSKNFQIIRIDLDDKKDVILDYYFEGKQVNCLSLTEIRNKAYLYDLEEKKKERAKRKAAKLAMEKQK